ncbi:MAG: CD225/dispanin family protein [Actinomycetes bacterium]
MVWAILTTIFCCLPLGVVSIVYAAQVNSKWAMGDVNGAMESSKNARNFAIISAVISAVIGVIWIIVVVLGAALSGGSSSSGSSL